MLFAHAPNVCGQRLDFSDAALADTLTGFARAFGAPGAPAAKDDDPFACHGLSDTWNRPVSAPVRRVTACELLMGMSFRAVLGQGSGSQFTSGGQGTSVSRFSGSVPGLSLSGETATGALGVDYECSRLRTGVRDDAQPGRGHRAGRGPELRHVFGPDWMGRSGIQVDCARSAKNQIVITSECRSRL